MVRTGKIPLFVPTLKSGPGETLRLKRRRGNEDEEASLPERPYVIPTLKSGPSEALRLKRSAVQCRAHAYGVGNRKRERVAIPLPIHIRVRSPRRGGGRPDSRCTRPLGAAASGLRSSRSTPDSIGARARSRVAGSRHSCSHP